MQPKFFALCDFSLYAATSHTPPTSSDVWRSSMSRDKNQVPEKSAHAAHRMLRPRLPPSRLRGIALRGRSLPLPTRQETITNSRPTSQERAVRKEESCEIRVGLQNLSDRIMNVSHRLDRMKETQESRPAKSANLSQPDSGRGDYMSRERDLRAPFFQQTL